MCGKVGAIHLKSGRATNAAMLTQIVKMRKILKFQAGYKRHSPLPLSAGSGLV